MVGMIRIGIASIVFISSSLAAHAAPTSQTPKKSTSVTPAVVMHPRESAPRLYRYVKHPARGLVKALKESGVLVAPEGTRVMLMMPEHTNFSPQGSTVNISLMNILDTVAKVMQQYPYTIAAIHGYADKEGGSQMQQALSERRAHSVIAYLESRGISGSRLVTVGHGGKPLSANPGKPYTFKDRRVAISLHSFTHRNLYDFRG